MNLLTLLLENDITTPVTEDYPTSFDMDFFKTLPSFNQRIQYCEKYLQRISSGSSRIVYKIDDQKVLKLAKNKKGLAQNETEIDYSSELGEIVAKIFEYHPDYVWLEMELAQRVTASEFKQITGMKMSDFFNAISTIGNRRSRIEIPDEIYDTELYYLIEDLILNYNFISGDLNRPNSYGVVSRNGQKEIVVIDYGLTEDVWDTHYIKNSKKY